MLAAFAYFSILPVPKAATSRGPDPDTLAFLPLVGVIVGAVAGTIAWGASFVLPHPIVAALAFAATLALTGTLHVDGFLDSADALFVQAPVARRLAIFKDPHHGTFAIASFAAVAALWLTALWSYEPASLPGAMALAAGSARFGAMLNAYVVPYARAGSNVPVFQRRPAWWITVVVAAAICGMALTIGPWAWTVLAGAGLVGLALGLLLKGRLGGGLVGDVYGFMIVVLEVGVLCALTITRP